MKRVINAAKQLKTCARIAGISIRRKTTPKIVLARALRMTENARAGNMWNRIQKLEAEERYLNQMLAVLKHEFRNTYEYTEMRRTKERVFGEAIRLRTKLFKIRDAQKERKKSAAKK